MTYCNCYNSDQGSLVSVIIPTYNRAHFIKAAIQSVLEQTYSNLELIVVDDGSTDNTHDVVKLITDDRLLYIQQSNRGRSNARNHAISLARGKYIAFLDSDDIYLPNKIELQVNYLKNHSDVGMVYTSAYCINEQGEMLIHRYEANVSGFIYENIAFFVPVTITLPTVMTYKTVLNQVGGFDEKMHRFEDTDMWRRISKIYRINAIPEFTCLLRTHSDNALLNQNPEQISTALDYYTAKILREDQIEIDINILNRGIARLYQYYAAAFMSVPEFRYKADELLYTARFYQNKSIDLNQFNTSSYGNNIRSCFFAICLKLKKQIKLFLL